jgi:FtsH-binding integral membrane protein
MSRYPTPIPSGPYDPYARRAQAGGYARESSPAVATFLNAVYAWMCVGLATTAVVGWWTSTQPQLVRSIFASGFFWILVIAELGLVFAISYAVKRISTAAATAMFVLYSALNGLTLSVIFLVYSLNVIGVTFAVTAGMFGAMSVVGYVTRRDLSSLGSFLFMALIGLIIASVVNVIWANSTLYWIVTYAGVAIFLGLTVYDTNRIKQLAYATEGDEAVASRLAIVGSLILYLDFINLFLFLLRILGNRRQ